MVFCVALSLMRSLRVPGESMNMTRLIAFNRETMKRENERWGGWQQDTSCTVLAAKKSVCVVAPGRSWLSRSAALGLIPLLSVSAVAPEARS